MTGARTEVTMQNPNLLTMRFQTSVTPLALLLAAAPALAQGGRPPVRQLGATVARTAQPLTNVTSVRHLPGNRLLVNEPGGRRVLMFDSTLANFTVVADSTAATANAYSGRVGGLIAWRGDSTLFVDPQSLSMLVIDPQGKVTRVMSVPRTQDAMSLAMNAFGSPALDASGRLVYRAMPNFRMMGPPPGATPGAPPAPPSMPDTAAIVRIDVATRQLDTVGFVKIPAPRMNVQRDDNGGMTISSVVNPLPTVDEWAVLADGSIAFVRGRDYHVDWLRPDGSRSSSTKVPFDWQRLTDEDKVAFIDSVKAARERLLASAPQGGGVGGMQRIIEQGAGGAGGGMQVTIRMGGAEGEPPRRGGQGQGQGQGSTGAQGGQAAGQAGGGGPGRMPRLDFVDPAELPDYKPAFFAGAARADADGNLWIQTIPTRAIAGGPVYDVMNAQGEVIERVQVPAGRTIIGFGRGGVVYLAHRDGQTVHLERASVR